MLRSKDLPLMLLLVFMLVYTVIGNAENTHWSGLYFISVHTTMLLLFKESNSKFLRIIGISLNLTVLVYVILVFFLNFHISKLYNLLPLIISLIGLILKEKKQNARDYK